MPTGWTVRGSNPGGERFSAPVQTGPEAHPASCKMGTGSFPEVRCCRGVTLTPHPLLVQRSKIEYSYTSALPKGLRGLWKSETYLPISILYMFRATPCSSSGESIVSIQPVVYVTLCRWPFRVQVGKGCSKHVENWNKYIGKNCGSSWSFTKN